MSFATPAVEGVPMKMSTFSTSAIVAGRVKGWSRRFAKPLPVGASPRGSTKWARTQQSVLTRHVTEDLALMSRATRGSGKMLSESMGIAADRPFYMQGDEAVHTREAWGARMRLRKDGAVVRMLQHWWEMMLASATMLTPPSTPRGRTREVFVPFLRSKAYIDLHVKLYRVLITDTPFDEDDAAECAKDAWDQDSEVGPDGRQGLSRERFMDAIFDLVDIWEVGVTAADYVRFGSSLLRTVARGDPPLLRPIDGLGTFDEEQERAAAEQTVLDDQYARAAVIRSLEQTGGMVSEGLEVDAEVAALPVRVHEPQAAQDGVGRGLECGTWPAEIVSTPNGLYPSIHAPPPSLNGPGPDAGLRAALLHPLAPLRGVEAHASTPEAAEGDVPGLTAGSRAEIFVVPRTPRKDPLLVRCGRTHFQSPRELPPMHLLNHHERNLLAQLLGGLADGAATRTVAFQTAGDRRAAHCVQHRCFDVPHTGAVDDVFTPRLPRWPPRRGRVLHTRSLLSPRRADSTRPTTKASFGFAYDHPMHDVHVVRSADLSAHHGWRMGQATPHVSFPVVPSLLWPPSPPPPSPEPPCLVPYRMSARLDSPSGS
jgi:hypothetical protein